MKMSKVKSADSVVHQFLRVLSKPSQAPKCHWSNCDCPKNPKETHKLRPECWWECHKTSDPTSSQVIHQTIFHQIFSHKKQMTQIKASEDPKNGGQKKKKKNQDEKKKNQTVDWRDGEMIDFLGLCSYPDTLSLPYNHNSSHRHIGRAICVRISRQIRWCWITASNHTTLPQHQIVSPFYLWITWASTQIYKWFGGLYAERTSRW